MVGRKNLLTHTLSVVSPDLMLPHPPCLWLDPGQTYFLVLLLHMSGTRCSINMGVWLLDALLGISPRVSRLYSRLALHWAPMFYHQVG